MNKLRKAAKDQECTLMIFPYCQGFGDNSTTVLAHLPSSMAGMGTKSPNWWGVHACAACHDIIDGRKAADLPEEEIQLCIRRGLFRTLSRLIESGSIQVND